MDIWIWLQRFVEINVINFRLVFTFELCLCIWAADFALKLWIRRRYERSN